MALKPLPVLPLYNYAAFVIVDSVKSVEDLKSLNLPDSIINDLICRFFRRKELRQWYLLMRSVIGPRRSKPVVYLDSDDSD